MACRSRALSLRSPGDRESCRSRGARPALRSSTKLGRIRLPRNVRTSIRNCAASASTQVPKGAHPPVDLGLRVSAAASRTFSTRLRRAPIPSAWHPRRDPVEADRGSSLRRLGMMHPAWLIALNVAHDLFERIPDEPATFRWLADARPVHDQAAGALSGRRLAVVAHFHARQLDPGARGLNYQKLTGSSSARGTSLPGWTGEPPSITQSRVQRTSSNASAEASIDGCMRRSSRVAAG